MCVKKKCWLCCMVVILAIFPLCAQTALEQRLEEEGLVDVHRMDSTIQVRLMYARADNFVGKVLYKELTRAYLLPETARALVKAQQILKRSHPDYSLCIYDAARPMSVQQQMWNAVAGTSKYLYVSNPAHGGGLHNYGLAVDVSIVDGRGDSIPMGTRVDHLGKEAHIDTEVQRVNSGKLSRQAYQNRLLLRRVMREAGFKTLRSEWWHFNFKSRAEAKASYRPVL